MSAYRVQGCRAYRARLDAIFDGVAPLSSRVEVEAHAEDCSACADELRRALEVRRWIDSTPETEPASQGEDLFISGVLDRMESFDPGRSLAESDHPRSDVAVAIRWGSRAAAALAAAALALWFFLPDDELPEASAPEVVAHAEPNAPGRADEVAESNAGSNAGSSAGAAPSYATLPEPAAIDLVAFSTALDELSSDSFRADSDLLSRDWFASITRDFGSDGAVRGARSILRDPRATDLAPLAARLLGNRADLRDRRLLTDTLNITGMAGALALAERGPSGVEILWRLAAEEAQSRGGGIADPRETPRATLAAKALIRWSQAGHLALAPSLDLTMNIPLAADLVAASGAGGAERLLDLYLADGEPEWLEAWEATPERQGSLESRLRIRPRRREAAESDRLLIAIERSRFSGGLAFALGALEDGNERAASALAALPGSDPLIALLGSASAGRLRPSTEDAAWGEFARRRSEELLAWVIEPIASPDHEQGSVVPRLALIVDECPEARRLLALISLESAVSIEKRTRALLFAAEGVEPAELGGTEPFDEPLCDALAALTGVDNVELAAAAWIACRRLGHPTVSPTPEISRALDRAGTGTVHHLRVVRAIERSRTNASRRTPARDTSQAN